MNEETYVKQWNEIWNNYLPDVPFQQESCLFHLGKTFLSDEYENSRNLRFCMDENVESCNKFEAAKKGETQYDFYMPTKVGYIKVGFDYGLS